MTIFDSLVFVGRAFSGAALSVPELLGRMDRLGIERAAVCPMKPVDYHLPPENEQVASEVARHPDRLVFLCRVDPNRADAVEEVSRCLGDLGARGVFLHPAEELFRANDPRVDPVVTEAERRGRPVLISAGYPWVSEPLQIADLASRFSRISVVMTNGGQLNISGLGMADAWIALEQHHNLAVQTAGEYRQDFIERIALELGGSRILFASSAPYFDQRYELARARQPALPDTEKQLMLGGAAEQLFA